MLIVVSNASSDSKMSNVSVSPYSEDSSEDPMSSGEESLSSSLGSDAEGPYFPLHIRRQKHRQHLHLA